jgi:ATP-binding cassette subfamily F protein uup
MVHVVSWAAKFLFKKEDLRTPIKALSGGEQARIHIARLMLEPADVLVLDEPTNDLDIPSLEVLENSIEEFEGAVVLVTHDRAMLAELSTQVLWLDGQGGTRYFTDYDQWSRRDVGKPAAGKSAEAAPPPPPPPEKPKLSYKEQQELAKMEKNIQTAEAEVDRLTALTSDSELLKDPKKLQEVCKKLAEAQAKVARMYARWEELEAMKK